MKNIITLSRANSLCLTLGLLALIGCGGNDSSSSNSVSSSSISSSSLLSSAGSSGESSGAESSSENLSSTSSASEWTLVWSDEFDYTGLPDASKWSYEVGMVRNNEAQFYTEGRLENARVENGFLTITALKESFKGAKYTSASLHTKGKASWTYGRIEARAKVPTGNGTWPAVWTLGSNIDSVDWPMCGEIDILENVGFDPNVVHGNVHTKKYNHAIGTNKGAPLTIDAPYEKFYVYAVEWSENKIDFFVDDVKYFTFENDGSGSEGWPFFEDQYLLLNLAIGGGWGGQKGIDDTLFPHHYLVDYVRVYQKK